MGEPVESICRWTSCSGSAHSQRRVGIEWMVGQTKDVDLPTRGAFQGI